MRIKKILLIAVTLIIAFSLFWFFVRKTKVKADYTPEYSSQPHALSKVYFFAVHPLHNPKRLFKVYQPLMAYLNFHTDIKIKLIASRNYAAYDKRLFNGEFHFALPNPYQTVEAAKHGYRIFGKMGDDKNFRGIILARKDSGIERVEDLKGKSVSYPAPTALAATMMPQWYLYSHGLDIKRDIKNLYVGSQESSIMNVYLGQTAAGATWPPPWQAFAKERPDIAKALVVKWQTDFLPNNGLVVRKDVPAEVVESVSKLLFNLHTNVKGRKILEAMELSRFEAANDSTYQSVRDFLKRFEKEIRPIRENK